MIFSRASKLSYGEWLALWLSRVFHPFVITIPTLALALLLTGSTWHESLLWTSVAVAIVTLPLALWVAVNVRRGRYSDSFVTIREQRRSLYLLAGICFIALTVVLSVTRAPIIALACLYAAVGANTIAAVVNRYVTKVSLHATATAGCAAVLFSLSAPIGAVLWLITLAVGWARVRLAHHTIGQILVGWGIATACVWIVWDFIF
jgi:membrane-associated phospholipid phosphatase